MCYQSEFGRSYVKWCIHKCRRTPKFWEPYSNDLHDALISKSGVIFLEMLEIKI